MIGVITSLVEVKPDYKLTTVESVLDETPVFNNEMLVFCKWISNYYLSSYGEVLKQVLPAALYGNRKKFVELNLDRPIEKSDLNSEQIRIIEYLEKSLRTKYSVLSDHINSPDFDKNITSLVRREYINIINTLEHPDKAQYLNFIVPVIPKPDVKTTKRIDEFYDFIAQNGMGILQKEAGKLYNFSDHIINRSVSLGLCNKVRKENIRLSIELTDKIDPPKEFLLTDEQNECVEKINNVLDENIFQTFLIYGLTGSGKTAVYIEAIKKVRKNNRSVIVLIPEISLTPQTVKRFREVFSNDIAILHSRLSEGEKYDSWKGIKDNKYPIVIGPRSAIFAPLSDLGLIIVDEEHESAYKQIDPSPRYNARDMAILRGKLNNIPVILGSATPSIESIFNAERNKFSLLKLTKRIGISKLPEIKVVKRKQFYNIFEDSVIEVFRRELMSDRQIIVLQNRRGYSTHLICESCGSVSSCPNCSVSLTYHLNSKQLICHHCGYYEKAKDYCGICGKSNISFKGIGTEQVAFELGKLFPDIKILRMDQDSTRKKESHFKILNEFENTKRSILVGTQMIAKGLDFHNVSLVCIVNVDTELIFPDFRSDERAFQLITQVSGRAGRGEIKGQVLIQTYNEMNHVLEFARKHDYIGFIKYELENRKLAGYPPYFKMAKIMFSSKDHNEVKTASMELYRLLKKEDNKILIYKPVDRMILKVNNIYRMNIIIKTDIELDSNGNILRSAINNALKNYRTRSNVKVSVDIDPTEVI
ncbi:MAG: primosomal protein N' [Candidatus Delongbacteria bacterium]|nr:primosomal protein N' [Candidatus Delongbacteria bacterium]